MSDNVSEAFGGMFPAFDYTTSTEQSNAICKQLAVRHLDCVTESGWWVARPLADYLLVGDFPSVVRYDLDVSDLCAADRYHISQVHAFFKKRADIDCGLDREGTAFQKWKDAEEACARTNARFRLYNRGEINFSDLTETALRRARGKIAKLVGKCPDLQSLEPRCGPGATTQVKKHEACLANKLANVFACSMNSFRLCEAMYSQGLMGVHLRQAGFATVELEVPIHHSRVEFVPKDAKTHRAIAVEPAFNSMMQLALGDYMSLLLRRVGIDLRDQTPNQRLALYGSVSGFFGTLDMSSASDTVSRGLVQALFPDDWVDAFETLRSQTAIYGGEVYILAKMSSMGNGFTFPLETIVFWALASSVAEVKNDDGWRRVTVYGDDIIAPSSACEEICTVLREVGFTPNEKKSFWDGPFRESCGSDYVTGVDVRPVFVDDALAGHDIFRLHNFYEASSWAPSGLQQLLVTFLDPNVIRYGPKGYGDGVLVQGGYDPIGPHVTARKGWCGFSFESWSFAPRYLDRKALLKFLAHDLHEVSTERLRRGFAWRTKHNFLVRILASYPRREDVGRPFYRNVLDKVVPKDDLSPFAIPGRGDAVLTSIYVLA